MVVDWSYLLYNMFLVEVVCIFDRRNIVISLIDTIVSLGKGK